MQLFVFADGENTTWKEDYDSDMANKILKENKS
jgi:hypothetical protein